MQFPRHVPCEPGVHVKVHGVGALVQSRTHMDPPSHVILHPPPEQVFLHEDMTSQS